MAPTGKAYHVDWVVATISNVHVANHRDWFTNYTPFPTKYFDAYGMCKTGVPAEGVGDVVLPVEKCSLTIYDVLYVPSAETNMFTIDGRFRMLIGNGGEVQDLSTGATLCAIDVPYLCRLRLRGQNSTQTSLDRSMGYLVNGFWPKSEQERWQKHKQSISVKPSSNQENKNAWNGDPPYDDDEKQWLKENFGNEFKFLMMYGLKIHDEDDRAEGRAIVRAFMSDEAH